VVVEIEEVDEADEPPETTNALVTVTAIAIVNPSRT